MTMCETCLKRFSCKTYYRDQEFDVWLCENYEPEERRLGMTVRLWKNDGDLYWKVGIGSESKIRIVGAFETEADAKMCHDVVVTALSDFVKVNSVIESGDVE